MLATAAVIVGLLLGIATGGSVANLTRTDSRGQYLVIVLFVLQALVRGRGLPRIVGVNYQVPLWALITLALVATTILAWRMRGSTLIAAGLVLNALVILVNGAMPVSVEGYSALGVDHLPRIVGQYTLAHPGTSLVVLGDMVPIPAPNGGGILVSIGDLLLAIGVAVVIVSLMGRERAIAGADERG